MRISLHRGVGGSRKPQNTPYEVYKSSLTKLLSTVTCQIVLGNDSLSLFVSTRYFCHSDQNGSNSGNLSNTNGGIM